jgi:predicted nucleotidyltransferase
LITLHRTNRLMHPDVQGDIQGGSMTQINTRAEVLEILRSLKDDLRERYHVERIALFGSYAREEQGEGSDIDLLVRFGSEADLFDLVGLSEYLEEILGRGVDVVSEAALRPEIRSQVNRDLIVA